MPDALLAAKITLEQEIAASLWRLFVPYVRERVQVVRLDPFRAQRWIGEFESVLAAHYARVVLVVTGREWWPGATLQEAAINVPHLDSLHARTRTEAMRLISGVERLVQAPERKSVEVKQEAEPPKLGWWGKAKQVFSAIKRKLATIAGVQTNGPAEEARMREAARRSGNRHMVKRWSTMRDHLVRDSHVDAEGQERLLTQPYDLAGGQLMHPGDGSLGASLGELINCRCSSKYVAINPDGTEEVLSETIRLTPVAPNRRVRQATRASQITDTVPLREGMITEVFLRDMLSARVSIRNGIIRVTRAGRRLAIGRYTHGYLTGRRVEGLTTVGGAEDIGIRELIDRSLRATHGR